MTYQWFPQKLGGWRSLGFVIATAVLLELISAIQYYYAHYLLENELEERVQIELFSKSKMLHYTLSSAETSLNEHLWDIQRNLNEPDSLFAVTQRLIEANSKIHGAFLAFIPDYYPQKGHLFEPYAYKTNNGIVVEQLSENDTHDYTKHPAYQRMEAEKKAFWSDPYQYVTEEGPQSLTTYSYPICDRDGHFIAICGIDLSLTWLGDTLNTRHMYPSSFNLFMTESGNLIAAPNKDSVSVERVNRVVSMINDSTVARSLTDNQRSTEIAFTEDNGDQGYIYYAHMSDDPHWLVAVVCYDDEVYGSLAKMRRHILLLMVAGFLLLGLIIIRTIRNMLRLKQAEIKEERINSELRVAKEIQLQMLPKQFPPYPNRKDIDIFGSLVTAREVGGDLFDFFLRDEKLFFCIGDVSGKGTPSAMLMAVTHALFRSASAHENNPARIMQALNEASCQGNDSNMFVTMFIGVLDLPTGHLRYCNAGHDAPFILSHEALNAVECKPHLPIGVFEDIKYNQQECQLEPGSTLFLYTDGLTEAKNSLRELFGLPRTKNALASCSQPLAPKEILEVVSEAVQQFVGDAEQSDDLTMLAIRYTPTAFESILSQTLTLKNDVHEVPRLHDFLKSVSKQLNMKDPLAAQLRLAVEEAVVNVMDYAYPTGIEGHVTIEALSNGKQLRVIITDSGIPFDPTTQEKADISLTAEERRIGGLGILLVRDLMDTVNYERTDGKNILTLIKEISNS